MSAKFQTAHQQKIFISLIYMKIFETIVNFVLAKSHPIFLTISLSKPLQLEHLQRFLENPIRPVPNFTYRCTCFSGIN